MDEKDSRQPIEQRHLDFGREVVALARQHGIKNFQASFYGGGFNQPWTRVTMNWSDGRHGSSSQITFKAEATHHCAEKVEAE